MRMRGKGSSAPMRWLVTVVATGALLAVIAVAVAAEKGGKPKPALVTIRSLTARSAVGTHCLPQGGGAVGCADYAYPLDPKGRLPAPPNSRVRIDVRRKASAVTASLVRRQGDDFEFVGQSLEASPAGERGRHWKLRLPADLEDANVLSIDVTYPDGDANFWAGLSPVERWPGAGGGKNSAPRPAPVTIRSLTAQAKLGTNCEAQGNDAVGCADSEYPLHPRGRLPAPPKARVLIDVRKKADQVGAVLVRSDGEDFEFPGPELEVSPVGAGGRRWTLRLPADLERANFLAFEVRYPNGDAGYWAGIKPVERWP